MLSAAHDVTFHIQERPCILDQAALLIAREPNKKSEGTLPELWRSPHMIRLVMYLMLRYPSLRPFDALFVPGS